jgi:uncharacterized protein (DUF1501 family)
LNAFYAATNELGVAQNVTTFTASDFGLTFPTNGTGSHHGWGSQAPNIGRFADPNLGIFGERAL